MSRLSRRTFLAAAGALAVRARAADAPAVPTSLDHILLGCGDLDTGIAFVEQRLGVRAAFGGVHPVGARGTRCSRWASGATWRSSRPRRSPCAMIGAGCCLLHRVEQGLAASCLGRSRRVPHRSVRAGHARARRAGSPLTGEHRNARRHDPSGRVAQLAEQWTLNP